VQKNDLKTLEAINQLRKEFPYAAALLVYVQIERELKSYFLSHRKKLKDKFIKHQIGIKREAKKKVICKTLEDANELDAYDDKTFIRNVLTQNTLGKIEEILGTRSNGPSEHRNNLVHSNLFIESENEHGNDERHSVNEEHLSTAINHLKSVLKEFANQTLIDNNGKLTIPD